MPDLYFAKISLSYMKNSRSCQVLFEAQIRVLRKSKGVKKIADRRKNDFFRLLKNAQMRGLRNPEE